MEIIVVGAGDVGLYVTQHLSFKGYDVTIADQNVARLEKIADSVDARTYVGDAMNRKALGELCESNPDLFIAATSSDATNIVCCARARSSGAQAVICRVDEPDYYPKNTHVITNEMGIDAIVCASRLLGLEFIKQMLLMDCEHVQEFAGFAFGLIEIKVENFPKLVEEGATKVKVDGNLKVCGVLRNRSFRQPDSIQSLMATDNLLIVGTFYDLMSFIRQYRSDHDRKAVIIGGGDVGLQLAESLESYENQITVIESSRERCEELNSTLEDTTIINGSGADVEIIKELALKSGDYVISVTGSDETNLMSALVAKDLGAGRCFTRVNRPGYETIYQHLNIDDTASPQQVMSSFVGNLLSANAATRLLPTEHGFSYYEIRIGDLPGDGVPVSQLSVPESVTLLGWARNFKWMDLSRNNGFNSGDVLVFVGPESQIDAVSQAVHTSLLRGGQ